MSRALQLEDFGAVQPGPAELFPSFGAAATGPGAPAAEEAAVAAEAEQYESGYRAGWEDSERTMQESRSALSAELARNLRDLAFTYHEARAHVTLAIEPLLRAMVERILPGLSREAFARAVVDELADVAAEEAEAPVTIMVAPGSVEEVRALLGDAPPVPCRVRAETALGEFQACFRLGETERLLDLDAILARVSGATGALFDGARRELAHA